MENLLPITVIYNGGNSFTLDWDETNPDLEFLNDWTKQQFMEAIRVGITEQLVEEEERRYVQ